MFIFVSGPYSSLPGEADRAIEENTKRADEVARKIAHKGHFPFVPHTMMGGWEDVHKVPQEQVSRICRKWLEKCDALYFIASSPGAESERKVAVGLGLPIYRNLDDIPEATLDAPGKLSPEALKGYLTEYAECANSYRHTYATIWQAGALFAVFSTSIVALAAVADAGFPHEMWVFAPLPVLAWFLVIFWPMNRYGDQRRTRLEKIEKLLKCRMPELEMKHFTKYNKNRKGKWRVVYGVYLCVGLLLLSQIYLIWVRRPQIREALFSRVHGVPQVDEPVRETRESSPVLPQSETDTGPPR